MPGATQAGAGAQQAAVADARSGRGDAGVVPGTLAERGPVSASDAGSETAGTARTAPDPATAPRGTAPTAGANRDTGAASAAPSQPGGQNAASAKTEVGGATPGGGQSSAAPPPTSAEATGTSGSAVTAAAASGAGVGTESGPAPGDASSANTATRPAGAGAQSDRKAPTPVASQGQPSAAEAGSSADGSTLGAGQAHQDPSATNPRPSAASQAAAPPAQSEVIVGLVEAPGKKATSTEQVVPQTLGGMLPMTVGVDGEGEFDFDKAILRQHVKGLLDGLAVKLKEADYDRLEIVGHTDRIGTDDYNQYLSERRAWAVARYLVKQGVPVTKMRVEGRGMNEPVTGASECAALSRDELIPCLQKDRRVVISASIRKTDIDVH